MEPSHSKSQPFYDCSFYTETFPYLTHTFSSSAASVTWRHQEKILKTLITPNAPVNNAGHKLTHPYTARHCPWPDLTLPVRHNFSYLLIMSNKICSYFNNLGHWDFHYTQWDSVKSTGQSTESARCTIYVEPIDNTLEEMPEMGLRMYIVEMPCDVNYIIRSEIQEKIQEKKDHFHKKLELVK